MIQYVYLEITISPLHLQSLPPLIGRLVPFTAVAAANCVNIPMMRMKYVYDHCLLLNMFDLYTAMIDSSVAIYI